MEQHMLTKAIWKRKLPAKGNKPETFVIFAYRSHVDMLTISIFIPVLLRPGHMETGALNCQK
jgi:hypothetical protein